MPYHMTNSSHAIDHFLRYMCCVACCWKSRLTPAVLCWKARPLGAAAFCRVETGRHHAVPCVRPGYALADRIVSRYFVWYRIVSIVFSYGCIVPSLWKLTELHLFVTYLSDDTRIYNKIVLTITIITQCTSTSVTSWDLQTSRLGIVSKLERLISDGDANVRVVCCYIPLTSWTHDHKRWIRVGSVQLEFSTS